jgi:hypothetical protein
LQEFFTKTKEGFINERVAKELGDFQKKSALAKKSAEVRWKKKANKNNDLDNANACETQSESDANGMLNNKHKTINIKQETVNNIKDLSPTVSKPVKKKFCAIEYALELQNSLINLAAWQEWVEYRKGKKKAISKPAANKQLKILEAHTLDQQQQIIDQSITNDYQGLFPVKQNNQIGGQSKMDTLLKNNYDSAQDFING